jgi:hypothetical protein
MSLQQRFSDIPLDRPDDRWSETDNGAVGWCFSCTSFFDGEIVSEGPDGKDYSVSIAYKRASIKLGLKLDVAYGEHPTEAQVKQIEGYATICKLLYAKAENTAETIVEETYLEPRKTTGPNREAAIKSALAQAAVGYGEVYLINTQNLARRVSRAYDAVCEHTTLSPDEAVDQAFKLAEKKAFSFNFRMRPRGCTIVSRSAK